MSEETCTKSKSTTNEEVPHKALAFDMFERTLWAASSIRADILLKSGAHER